VGASPELAKLYYRIGEVAQIVGVQPHVLRYWESEFRTIRPRKSTKGQRVYSRRDVEKLLRVKDLLKNQGFTIAGAKKQLRDFTSSAASPAMESAASPAPSPAAEPQVVSPEQRGAAQVVAPRAFTSAAPVGPPPPPRPSPAVQVRQALVALREDVVRMLEELGKDDRGR
jgi:DNA-binding transcriptional MerR regulator